jgi:methionyl-tRNA formyltransferase
MRFVLFCNQGYGAAFEEGFRHWCRARRIADHAVVHSLRGHAAPAGGGPARRALLTAAHALRRLAGDRTIEVEDVNAPGFVDACLPRTRPVQGIVAGFNQIFSTETIARFAHLYNFHPSLLPYYRGPVPSYWCIRNGERATGITLHEVGPRIDQGRILWQEEVPITTSDPEEMDRLLSRRGAAILPRVLDSLLEGGPMPEALVPAERVYRNLVDYRSFPR